MARSHARIAVTIWQDDDFLALRPGPQRLYLFLVSQPNLTHLGVLPLTLRRWVRTADAYTLDDLGDDLDALEEAGFVVVDEDAEELLVRSYMRNDGVYKQPNVLTSAVASVRTVHSGQVKRALLAEVARIDLTILSDEGGDKSKRAVAAGLLEQLREGIGEPPPEPHPKGSRNPSPNPSLGVPETPYAGAGAQPLSLTPSPTPIPEDTSSSLRDDGPSDFEKWWEQYPRKVGKQAAEKAYRKALKTTDAATLLAAVTAFGRDPNLPTDRTFICHPATWLNEGRWDDEPQPQRGGLRSVGVPDRIAHGDARLQAWYDAARREGVIPEIGA